jgi:Protein of unknown function (DUF1616)
VKGHGDLRLVAWGSLLCAVTALLAPWGVVSLIFAAPLALVMPGYAIAAAAFARRELEWAKFAVLSVALSLATLALGGLILNYAPGGIRGVSWAVLLLLVVLGGCSAAALRRKKEPAVRSWPRIRLRPVELGLMLAGLAAVVAALVLSAATLTATDALGFTALWIVPATGSGRSEARIGVRSEELGATDFDLRIRIGKRQIVRRSFRLRPGEGRVVTVGPPAAPVGSRVPVVATLLRHNHPFSVYRRVKGSLVAPGASR